MPPKGKKAARVSPKTWGLIKGLYVGGNFSSIEDLHSYLEKNFESGTYPSFFRLRAVANKQKWYDEKTQNPVKDIIAQSTLELFAQEGMPKREAVKLCIEGMTAGRQCFEKLQKRIVDEGNMPQAIEILEFMKNHIKDQGVALRYLSEYNKMCGNYEPVKVQDVTTEAEAQSKANDEAYKKRFKLYESAKDRTGTDG
jgi:hypothetical protein